MVMFHSYLKKKGSLCRCFTIKNWNVLLPLLTFPDMVIIGGSAAAWDVNKKPSLVEKHCQAIKLQKDKNDINRIQLFNIIQCCSILFNITEVLDIKTLDKSSPSVSIPAISSFPQFELWASLPFFFAVDMSIRSGHAVILWQPPWNGLFLTTCGCWAFNLLDGSFRKTFLVLQSKKILSLDLGLSVCYV